MMMGSCRISQQVRDCNPRQFGIWCCRGNCRNNCFNRGGPSQRPTRRFPFWFRSKNTCSTKFNSLSKRASYAASCSSSLVTSNSDELLPGLSNVNSDSCKKYASEAPLLSDLLSLAENGGCPTSPALSPVAGGIVALGKFDALHIGHRELAIQAAKIGVPFLLSFAGIAEVLGWAPRVPIVAQCDRTRVLSSWTPSCENMTPKEFQLEFSKVRHLTPQQFVAKLAEELGVCGVVAGENYRFGYKAAGSAADLVRLCGEYGMVARVIGCVMDKNQDSTQTVTSSSSKERGQVSSTQVRHALSIGDMKYVSELLGRPHRLILQYGGNLLRDGEKLWAPRSCFLNLPPKDGAYMHCSLIVSDGGAVPCRAVIDTSGILLKLEEDQANPSIDAVNTHDVDFEVSTY